MNSRPRGFVVVLAGWFFATGVCAGDWPRWRGPHSTGHVPPGEVVPDRMVSEPRIVWRLKAGEGLASPVVAGGRVFLFDNSDGKETLRAMDASEGTELWRTPIDDPFSDSQGPTGPRCTPFVDEDRVYAVSCKGELQCLKASNGARIWRVNYTNDFGAEFIGEKGNTPGAARHGNNGSPLILGDRLYACVGGREGAGVVCFDKRTGKTIWSSQDDQAGYAPPVVANLAGTQQLLCFTAVGFIGLDPDRGGLLWRVPMKTAYARHVTTPIAYGDLVVVASHQIGLVATRISRVNEGMQADQAWLSKEAAMNFSSPVAVGQYLYGLGPARNLICVDLPTGQIKWSKEGLFSTSADKAYAGFLAMGANILVLTDTGTLLMFRATPQAYEETGRAQVCGMNWCNPAYSNGLLYVRDGLKGSGELLAIRIAP